MAKKKNRAGRPKGSKNREVATVLVQPAVCPQCGSTKRSRYTQTATQQRAGSILGKTYSHIVRRWCRCTECDQWRIEKHFENHPGEDAQPQKPAE